MKKNNSNINLKPYKFSFEQNGYIYNLLFLNKNKMTIDIEIYQNDKFIKNSTIPFAQIPKALKVKINPL